MRRLRLADPMPIALGMAACAAYLAFAAPGWGGGGGPAISAASVHAAALRETRWLVRPGDLKPSVRRPRVTRIKIPAVKVHHSVAPVPIAAIAAQYGVPAAILRRVLRWRQLAARAWPGHAALVLSVVATESGGHAHAVHEDSPSSFDLGVMQLNTATLPSVGLTWQTAMIPARNIAAGVSVLRSDVSADGSEWAALNAYNGGCSTCSEGYAARVWGWLPATRAALAS